MTDTAAPAPSAPAPAATPSAPSSSPAPSSPIEPSSPETLDQLAAPESVDEYIAQRRADEGQIEREASEPKRRANRFERIKYARNRAQAEAAALKAQRAGPRSADGTPEAMTEWAREVLHPEEVAAEQAAAAEPTTAEQPAQEGFQPTPEERAEVRQRLAQQAASEIEARAIYREREQRFAAMVPNYHEVMKNVADVELPHHVADLIRASPHGVEIAYHLAASVDGLEWLMRLREMSPTEATRFIAKSEAIIDMREQRAAQPQQRQQPQRRVVSSAPPPIRPLRGSAAPPRDYRALAEKSDDVTGYVNRRKQEMRNGRTSR